MGSALRRRHMHRFQASLEGMLSRLARLGTLGVVLASCAPATDPSSPPLPVVVAPPPTASASVAPEGSSSPATALGAPLSGPPRLVIENHSSAEISLYAGTLVDEEGKLGTMSLWPHPSDCPKLEAPARVLPKGGVYELAAPTHAFDEARCAPGRALPPGRYVVHLASGYGDTLYASAELTLPLSEPVRLKMMQHEDPPTCTPLRAQRAARLVLAAARAEGASDALLSGCDPTAATCDTLPLPDDIPPTACAIRLHESLLRIRRPPGGDQPKEITSWLDPEIVFTRRPDVSRSSAAELVVGGARVVLEGMTRHHLHEHGGQAAQIASMQVRVHNGSQRKLAVKALAVEWLTDSSCGVPKPASPPPAVTGVEPSELPPGVSELSIRFTPRNAYQAHCDVFASRARLQVDGKDVVVTGEHEVTRIEPLR